MSKKILKYTSIVLGSLVLLIIYLSTAGIETKKFNNQIQKLVKQKNDKLDASLKKIKFTLDPLNFKVNAKTIDAIITFKNKQIELDYIKKLLVNKFGFNEKDANDNISRALEDSEQRIEIFSQIKVILNEMNHEERIEVIQMMWGVILADGVIDDFEANLMRRMNGLLYVSGVESATAKENAMSQLK